MATQRKVFDKKWSYIDSGFLSLLIRRLFQRLFEQVNVKIFAIRERCSNCDNYRRQLRMAHSRHSRKSSESQKFTNNRYLNTPQKTQKLKFLQLRASAAKQEIKRLKVKIDKMATLNGIIVDEPLHQDLCSIMNEQNKLIETKFPEGTFRRLFWKQQN